MKWDNVLYAGMPEYELPSGELMNVPESFSDMLDQFGFDERKVQLRQMQGAATVLVPSPMGELPGEISSKRASIPRAVKLFVSTPMEPVRLAVEDRPGPALEPKNMEEAMSLQNFPPTVAVPRDLREYMPFNEGSP